MQFCEYFQPVPQWIYGYQVKAHTMQTALPWVGLGMKRDGNPEVLSTALTRLSKYQAQHYSIGDHHYSIGEDESL